MAMPSTPPELALANKIASLLGSPWAVGTNIFIGPVQPPSETPSVPAEAIFCSSLGGPPPKRVFDGASSKDTHRPLVQVIVRSEAGVGEYQDGIELAREVNAAVNHATPTGYLDCTVQQAEPVYLLADSGGRHEFSVIVELWYTT